MDKYIQSFKEFSLNEKLEGYSLWKRDNVSYRGIRNLSSEDNGGMAKYGQGLYTTKSKSFAKEYGDVYFVVNGIPKTPKICYSVNEAEIFLQELVTKYCKENNVPRSNYYFSERTTIANEMINKGYDGLVIKGREMVNYKPTNIKFFKTEDELYNYYRKFY